MSVLLMSLLSNEHQYYNNCFLKMNVEGLTVFGEIYKSSCISL